MRKSTRSRTSKARRSSRNRRAIPRSS
jgi:hypothetical protein